MSINAQIIDCTDGQSACVNGKRAVKTYSSIPEIPPAGTRNQLQWFRQILTGLNVDGSTTPVSFELNSSSDYDIYITAIVFVLEDESINEEDYYKNTSLTNGVDLIAHEGSDKTYLLEACKSYGEIQLQLGILTEENRINTGPGNEIGILKAEIDKFIPGGIRIGRGTLDKFEFIVNDDLTPMINHELYFLGYKHVE